MSIGQFLTFIYLHRPTNQWQQHHSNTFIWKRMCHYVCAPQNQKKKYQFWGPESIKKNKKKPCYTPFSHQLSLINQIILLCDESNYESAFSTSRMAKCVLILLMLPDHNGVYISYQHKIFIPYLTLPEASELSLTGFSLWCKSYKQPFCHLPDINTSVVIHPSCQKKISWKEENNFTVFASV